MKMVAARETGCCEKLRSVFLVNWKLNVEKLDLQSENIRLQPTMELTMQCPPLKWSSESLNILIEQSD